MKKSILFAGVGAVLLLAAGGGGAFFFLAHGHKDAKAAKIAEPPKPKPIYFAELNGVVVSMPTDADNSGSTYVQIDLQFSTFDQNAVASFTSLQPIIKSEIIGLLMTENAKSLSDPQTRATLTKDCLAISNKILNSKANFTPPNPFTDAYITNLVVQN